MEPLDRLPGYRWVVASSYDERYRDVTPADVPRQAAALAPFLDPILALLSLPDEGTLLDLGCGPGLLAHAALAARPTLRVTGVDASARAVEIAREAVPAAAFVVGDAETPPAGEYDRVGALSLLSLLPDKRAALAAWSQALAPGGRLVVADGLAAAGFANGPGPLTETGIAALAGHAGLAVVRRANLTRVVAGLAARGAWPWGEYVRPGLRYVALAMEPRARLPS